MLSWCEAPWEILYVHHLIPWRQHWHFWGITGPARDTGFGNCWQQPAEEVALWRGETLSAAYSASPRLASAQTQTFSWTWANGFPSLSVDFSSGKWDVNVHMSSPGLPGGSVSKESACNAGDLGLIPRLGRSPGGGNGKSLLYSCLGNPMDRGAWWVRVHGVEKLDMTEWLNHHHTPQSLNPKAPKTKAFIDPLGGRPAWNWWKILIYDMNMHFTEELSVCLITPQSC